MSLNSNPVLEPTDQNKKFVADRECSKQTSQPPNPRQFLDWLPRELRDQVYRHLLVFKRRIVALHKTRLLGQVSPPQAAQISVRGAPIEPADP